MADSRVHVDVTGLPEMRAALARIATLEAALRDVDVLLSYGPCGHEALVPARDRIQRVLEPSDG